MDGGSPCVLPNSHMGQFELTARTWIPSFSVQPNLSLGRPHQPRFSVIGSRMRLFTLSLPLGAENFRESSNSHPEMADCFNDFFHHFDCAGLCDVSVCVSRVRRVDVVIS
jgi:hypothetical protein